jgi:hypothetical protein
LSFSLALLHLYISNERDGSKSTIQNMPLGSVDSHSHCVEKKCFW